MSDEGCVRLTPRAAAQIAGRLAEGEVGPAAALRISVIGGAASGLAYNLWISEPEPGDHCFLSEGVNIAVDPSSIPALVGSTVDWIEGENGAGFQILNPNVPHQR